ncbi:MAG: hypothetical protein AB1295_01655 [Candidatus Micrarchaeota archaeon]
MSLETEAMGLAYAVQGRLIELLLAPLNNQDMLWTAIPLLIATLFMTLYFGRNRKEELGWNTAFGNTMVFLFVAINIIRTMYNYGGSWESVMSNELYFTLSLGLAGASFLLMYMTYFHLLPKGFAFFIFSAPPINVTVYVIMTLVYADVPPDHLTALAGVAFLVLILIVGTLLKFLISIIGLADQGPSEIEEEAEKEEREEAIEKAKIRIEDKERASAEKHTSALQPSRKTASRKPPK